MKEGYPTRGGHKPVICVAAVTGGFAVASPGKPLRMSSDSSPGTAPVLAGAIGVPFRAAGALRHAKAFHPAGRTVPGTFDADAPAFGAVAVDPDVTVRLSKGVGLPGGLPDVLGVAIRLSVDDGSPWDLLLASSTRLSARLPLPVPARTWAETEFSSLTPFTCAGALWWVRAQTITTSNGADVPDGPVRIVLSQARGVSSFHPFATVTTDVRTLDDVDFDPVANLPSAVTMAPHWLARVRGVAYGNSRAGREISREPGTP